jgi:glycosyltransferase involved in cell wall biosynthesis
MATDPLSAAVVSIVIPVYRDAERAIALVHALAQPRPASAPALDIILVDDGSRDGTLEKLLAGTSGLARVHPLATNAGRSAARNAGAALARGDVILFTDCDCLPGHERLEQAHLQAWDTSTVASVGPVVGSGDGFWHRYQSAASIRRRRQHSAGLVCSGSSQNLMVSRPAFAACGGFDLAYCTYGFEDRDILMRLSALGGVAWAEAAVVRHMDALNMALVSRKLAEAGGEAAIVFSGRFPDAYRALGYDRLDARRHRWLQSPSRWASAMVPRAARAVDELLDKPWLPYGIKRAAVRLVSAASYLSGSR